MRQNLFPAFPQTATELSQLRKLLRNTGSDVLEDLENCQLPGPLVRIGVRGNKFLIDAFGDLDIDVFFVCEHCLESRFLFVGTQYLGGQQDRFDAVTKGLLRIRNSQFHGGPLVFPHRTLPVRPSWLSARGRAICDHHRIVSHQKIDFSD